MDGMDELERVCWRGLGDALPPPSVKAVRVGVKNAVKE